MSASKKKELTIREVATMGGKARAAKLTAEERRAIGKLGGDAKAAKRKLALDSVLTGK